MRHGLTAPSSPTPHREPPRSLIPSSPSGNYLHRNRLERGSSSAGHVTAAGLTTWRRKPRRTSSGEKSGQRGLGLGMGMEGTPGRRKKASGTSRVGLLQAFAGNQLIEQSLGVQSTPKRSSSKPPRGSRSSSLPLSSLPDPEDLTQNTLSTIGDPDIISPAAQSIRRADGDGDVKVSASIVTSPIDIPSETDALVTLFPELQEVVVPLNDMTESAPDDSIDVAGQPIDVENLLTQLQPFSTELIGFSTHKDFIVPLNDPSHSPDGQTQTIFDPITHEDLTVPLNDITPFQQTLLSSQPTSKLTRRQSTPYARHRKSVMPVAFEASSDEDESQVELGRGRPILKPKATIVSMSPAQSEQGTPQQCPLMWTSPSRDTAAEIDFEEEKAHDTRVSLMEDPVQEMIKEANPYVLIPRETAVGHKVLDAQDKSRRKHGELDSSHWGNLSGFARLQELLRDKQPRPFEPSSRLTTPARSRSSSNILFSATPSERSITSTSFDDDHAIPTTALGERASSPIRTRKGAWRGAEALARMEAAEKKGTIKGNEEDHEGGLRSIPSIGKADMAPETATHLRKRKTAKVRQESISEEAESVTRARQARIAHYLDLEKNYKLHIELVLG